MLLLHCIVNLYKVITTIFKSIVLVEKQTIMGPDWLDLYGSLPITTTNKHTIMRIKNHKKTHMTHYPRHWKDMLPGYFLPVHDSMNPHSMKTGVLCHTYDNNRNKLK